MKIAIVAPSPVPFGIGGAERLWWGLLAAINQLTPGDADLIKLPSPEGDFWDLMASYRAFSRLDLGHFDLVITTKYPAWMVAHPNHVCYMQHKLRGLYDTYGLTGLPVALAQVPAALRPLLDMLDRSRAERAELAPFFDLLFRLREDRTLPSEVFAFPGPLARRIVHFLDAIALEPGAIRRYLAISRTVARRADYFPAGVEVGVVHHPSDLPRFENTGYDYIFTASRLDGPKRLDLLIAAFRRLAQRIELRIAGTGPEAARLEALAAGDPRIRFLGRIGDEELIRQYGGALFVPFVPFEEDYGLITVEAMASGKAVLTTTDAGGVTELVSHGDTGLVTAPNPASLAEAMATLVADAEGTRAMGERARARVAPIDWATTVAALLGDGGSGAEASGRPAVADRARVGEGTGRVRPRLVVTVDFPVYPPRGGGQSRIFHLYKALARSAEVALVTLCDDPARAGDHPLAPGLREVRVAKSKEHLAAQKALDERMGRSVADIANLFHWDLMPDYLRVLEREAAACDLLIASHPYLYPAIGKVYGGPLWYEAHNVELDMKRAVLAACDEAGPYLARVRETEQAICGAALRVMVCAERDASRLQVLYGIDAGKCLCVPNGVDTKSVRYTAEPSRGAAKSRLGLSGRFAAVYVASWHQPNIEGLGYLKQVAADCPEVDFLVVGSVCLHPEAKVRPGNLHPLGVLSDAELAAVLAAADLALNPITSGSGTNVKMLHYAAAGIPILSTPFGNRGLDFVADEEVFLAEAADFAGAIAHIRALGTDGAGAIAARARQRVEADFDWSAIVEGLVPLLVPTQASSDRAGSLGGVAGPNRKASQRRISA